MIPEGLIQTDAKETARVRTVYVHIGKPRTATTSFQSGICKAEEALRSKGLCVPRSGRLTARHMQLAWASSPETLAQLHPWHQTNYDGRSVEEHVALVMAEAEGCKDVLVSNEWFGIFPDLCFQPMIDAFGRHARVVALITLRDQADAFYSAYMQQIQARSFSGPIDRFSLNQAEYGKREAPFDHEVLVRNWSSMCEVRLFRFGPHICEQIMSNIGHPDSAQFERENGSVPFELSGFIRRQAAKDRTPKQWNGFVARVRAHPEDFSELADPSLLEDAAKTKRRIAEQFADSNGRLEQDFGHLFADCG